ncbi:MAG: alpha/beta fold hydrolase [Desulfomonile tiedjei]|uniref:Alpha/beta fold hydrolase n=1 Tax=Desulfomonile tiedjei TaxID=2358 RepID=A0A9D6V134_9BACT|nr:alpha/beta fold hydrolase [Desulfomonile tiedjei]
MNDQSRVEVFIPCGTLTLEGILEHPDADGDLPAAVICHPHPLYGGNMHNNVVRALRKALLEKGVACLRFNFRGAGRSWGTHGEGVDEIQDVLAALDFVEAQERIDPERILLAGYSFGCWVGLHAASRDPRPSRLIGISPPLDVSDFGFLRNEKRPKLIVAGDNDFVCSVQNFRDLMDEIPEPKRGVLLDGVDHFYFGKEDNLVREVAAFLDQHPLVRR